MARRAKAVTAAQEPKGPKEPKRPPKPKAAAKKVLAPQLDDLRMVAHHAAVLVIDGDDVVVFATEAAAETLGKSVDELTGQTAPVPVEGAREAEWRKTPVRLLELKPAEKAEDHDTLKSQLAEAHARLVTATQLEWKLEVAQARSEELEQELQQARDRFAELEREFAERPAADDPSDTRVLAEQLEAELERRAELERDLAETREAGEHFRVKLNGARARTAELERTLAQSEQLQAEYRRFEEQARSAEARTSELERRLPTLENDLRRARSHSQELEGELSDLRSRSQELEGELTELRSRSQEMPGGMLSRVQDRERTAEHQALVTRAEAHARELQAQLDATSARCRELEARVEMGSKDLQEQLMQAHGRVSVLEGLLTEATTQIEKAVAPELERQLRHALARADDLEEKLKNVQPSTPLAQVVKLGELEVQLAYAHVELSRLFELEQAATARANALEAVLRDADIARVPTVSAQPAQPLEAADQPMPGLLYEPIFELASGRLAGVEATPCWDDPEHGIIRVPGDSLPVTTCYQMLIEVCQLAAAWRAEGFSFFTALDTGSALLHHPELPGILQEAMRLGGLPPDMVMLDIPGLASSEDGRLEAVLGHLGRNGVGLAVDGLGLGTASFAHLALANLAKLDARLVGALPQHAWAVQSAKAVLGLARGQGIRSAAVGVETEAQFRWLRNAQCDLGQGTHLSPPVLPEQILDFARWGRLYA